MKRDVPTRRVWVSVLTAMLPLWVYWTIAGATVTGATIFSVMYDASDVPPQLRSGLGRVVWSGPIACVVVAILMSIVRRMGRS